MEVLNEPLVRFYKRLSVFLGVTIAIIGLISYLGAIFHVSLIPAYNPIFATGMAPSPALIFVVLGLMTAFVSHYEIYDETEQQVLIAICAFVTTAALAILGKYLFNYSFDLDSLVWGQTLPGINVPCQFRMSPSGGLCLVFIGLAFGFLTSEMEDKIRFGQGLLLIPILLSSWVCFSFVFNTEATLLMGYTPMPIHTAVMYFFLCIACLLTKPERGFVWIFSSNTAGGVLIREILPMALIVPTILSCIFRWGEKQQWYCADASLALMSTSISASFIFFVLWSLGISRDLDLRRKLAVQEAQELNLAHQERLTMLEKVHLELRTISFQAQKARDQALAASQMKSEFVAKMSNEIRMPMNGVLSIVEALLRTELSNTVREYVLVMRDAGRAFLVIINDILDFSSIEEGSLVIENGPVGLEQIVDGVGKLLASQAYKKNLLFVTFVDPSVPDTIVGDEVRLRQVLINLAGNAIKFTENGKVIIRVNLVSETEREVTIRFAVEDTGIGISEEERHRLFQPFVQADGTINRKYGGTGLGLSISKKLVELMGGEIGADSVKGQGSTFWFTCTFPATRRRGESSSNLFPDIRALLCIRDYDSDDVLTRYLKYFGCNTISFKNKKELRQLIDNELQTGSRPTILLMDSTLYNSEEDVQFPVQYHPVLVTEYDGISATAPFKSMMRRPFSRAQLFGCLEKASGVNRADSFDEEVEGEVVDPTHTTRRRTVDGFGAPQSNTIMATALGLALVVDDSSINRHVAVVLLENLGMLCHTAANGLQAIKEYNARPYDIILMDCQMPEMDGYAATKQIRRLEKRTGCHVPIVALTANVIEGSREACLAAGMDDYMSKPVNADVLEQTLQKWVPKMKNRQSESAASGEDG
ncbi:MAG: response regulator [Cyanobacteria bacterium]|nr:response regulator [Cyanobacteriota bacterium]